MTIDTTFKEFVDENGINFCLLNFGFRKYRKLIEALNKVKFRLGAEEEAREYEKIRAWLLLSEQSAMEDLRSRRSWRPGNGRFAAPQPLSIVSSQSNPFS
jgi:hypothetical protein